MSIPSELQATVEQMAVPAKGILAADESQPTIKKRFQPIDIPCTEETRQQYRSLLFTTPGLGEFISGVILFEETLTQTDDSGTPLPQVLSEQGIVPGIKVDKGKIPMVNSPGDVITQGLDGLAQRLETYKQQGARFAKWREVYNISAHNPTQLAIEANAEVLARYAAICQGMGIVPIVEPEVLMDGDHDMARCAEVTEAVQHAVFHALHRHGVSFEHMILKPNMITPGKDNTLADPEVVAAATIKVLQRTVPAAVPSINFLSGGQTPEESTANLNAINAAYAHAPWYLSFSYGRALQQPVLQAWGGKPENAKAMQAVLAKRAKLNSEACQGHYKRTMEQAA